MHGRNVEEERLDGRVVGDGAAATRVGFHSVDKDVEGSTQRRAELVHLVRLAVLILLTKFGRVKF